MKKIILIIAVLLLSNFSFSANYFVATNGNDSNNGSTIDTPFASIVPAVSNALAGDTIWVRGGTFEYSSTISISKSGNESNSIYLLAYNDEKPLFDFSGTAFGKRGISLTGNYWIIKGFEMQYAGDNAIYMSGSSNTIENCSFHDNKDTGLQLGKGASNNNIINCDSYFNADPTDYGDADGFAAKLDVGTNNYFYGCRAWCNVDDGWDGYMRGNDDVNTVLENCWTWGNGYFKDGTDAGAKANGNGFKVGGSDGKDLKHNFTLINCLAFYNKAKGFDQNNNMGDMFFYNCTGFGNKGNDFSIPKAIAAGKTAEVKNCILFKGTKNLARFVVQECNSWDTRFKVDESDFISIDTTGISSPRKPDGSLPDIEFMHLAEGSDLINAGIDLGYPFLGTAPDLGAFETSSGVGFREVTSLNQIKAYMNRDGNISVHFEQEKEGRALIDIYNLSGIKMAFKQFNGLSSGMQKVKIENSLSHGIYIIGLKNNGKTQTTTLIIN